MKTIQELKEIGAAIVSEIAQHYGLSAKEAAEMGAKRAAETYNTLASDEEMYRSVVAKQEESIVRLRRRWAGDKTIY